MNAHSDDVLDALKHAVALAKELQVKSVKGLRERLLQAGHTAEVVNQALSVWRSFVRAQSTQ